jgi:hypothetical protein
MPTYYMLECYGPAEADRAAVRDVLNDDDFSWNLGRKFASPPPAPIQVKIEPGLMMPMFNRGILLFSDQMLSVLAAAGVDNLDAYPATLEDLESGQIHQNYKAINILGVVAAADLSKSQYVAHSASKLIDTDFDSLAIKEDAARGLLLFRLAEAVSGIVIHERVKQALEAAGIQYLDFVDPKDWIG